MFRNQNPNSQRWRLVPHSKILRKYQSFHHGRHWIAGDTPHREIAGFLSEHLQHLPSGEEQERQKCARQAGRSLRGCRLRESETATSQF